MRFGGRLQAAIEVLDDLEARRRPAADALKDWGLSHRFAGSGDRAAIGNIVYDALRWRASNAFVMGNGSGRAQALATVVWRWGMGLDGLAAAIGDDRHAPEAPSDDEIARLSAADLSAAPDDVRADVPAWIAPHLERMFGSDWVEEAIALSSRSPLDIRANRLKADREKVRGALQRFGAVPTSYSPDGLRISSTEGDRRHPNIQLEPAFQKGWFEIQDEGSQLAAMAVAPKPSDRVLDICAGAGGKSLALAGLMRNAGQVIATDNDRSRLAPIFERLKRSGAHNVEVRAARASLDDLVGRMDAVLIDAPCTGTGTWRRRPDAKWRLTERAFASRLAEQTEILATAARYVKPGGRLVYVTCSVLPEENSDQIDTFTAQNPAFTALPAPEIVARIGAAPALAEAVLAVNGGIALTPRRTETDGFFISIMELGA